MKRLLATLASVTVAALLFVALAYAEAHTKAREDIKECTPTAAEVAEHREFAARLADHIPHEVVAHPQFHRIVGLDAFGGIIWVEDCVDDRRAARWGPWNAWNRLERLERLLGRDQD